MRLYDHYVAQQSESVDRPFVEGRNFTVHRARKSQTFYYNGLDANGFDEVINPSVIEPPVQFTLYLKVKFDAEPVKAP